MRIVMDSPKNGCLHITVKSTAGPEVCGRFYEEIAKAAGDKKYRAS